MSILCSDFILYLIIFEKKFEIAYSFIGRATYVETILKSLCVII